MRTIWKYPLQLTEQQTVTMTKGAEILHVGLDADEIPCVWAEVESLNDPEPIYFFVVGTGNRIPLRARTHQGSFIQKPFVWHVFTL